MDENEDCIEFFVDVIRRNYTVKELSMRKCEVKDGDMFLLKEALRENKWI